MQSRVSHSTAIFQNAKLNSRGEAGGASNMPVILSDLLLFGFMAAFTTWLIIEIAKLLS